MIPYHPPPGPLLTSPITLEVFGLLVATGSILGYFIVVSRSHLIGLSRAEVRAIGVWVLVFAFLTSYAFSALYELAAIARDPLRLVRQPLGLSSFGGMFGGLLGVLYGTRVYGGNWRHACGMIDQVAYAFPFGWVLGRFGCFLVHDHIGIPGAGWLALRFPDGPRYDLGLLEFLLTIPWLTLFWTLGRKPRPNGAFAAWTFAIYGPFRVLFDQLRAERVYYGPLTVDEWTGIVMGAMGWCALARIRREGYCASAAASAPVRARL